VGRRLYDSFVQCRADQCMYISRLLVSQPNANTNRFDGSQTNRSNELAVKAGSVKIWTIIFPNRPAALGQQTWALAILAMPTNIPPTSQRREMTDLEKGKIIAYWECNLPITDIAAAVGRPWGTVNSILQRYRTRGKLVVRSA